MSNNNWFSISGIGCAAHTAETREKWHSLPAHHSKSDYGKLAILKYAQDLGFECSINDIENLKFEIVEDAYNYIVKQVFGLSPDVSGKKSDILRTAIIHYS